MCNKVAVGSNKTTLAVTHLRLSLFRRIRLEEIGTTSERGRIICGKLNIEWHRHPAQFISHIPARKTIA